MTTQVDPASITRVMQTACAEYPQEEMRLSLLLRAFVAGCKALGIPQRVAMREVEKAWQDGYNFVRIISAKAKH